MKNKFGKILLLILVSILIIPQLVFASWWNPVSWFNNWSFFHPVSSKTQILENRVKELEKKLESASTSTTPSVKENSSAQTKTTIKPETKTTNFWAQDTTKTNSNSSTNTTSNQNKGENYVSIPLGVLDSTINNYSKEIDFINEAVPTVQDSINYVRKMKAIFEGARDSGYGDANSIEIDKLFIEQYNSELNYYNKVLKYFSDSITAINNNISILRQNRAKMASLFYNKEQSDQETKIQLEGSYANFMTTTNNDTKEYTDFNKYYKDSRNQELEIFTYLKSYYSGKAASVSSYSNSNYVPTYTAPTYTPQVLPQIKFPTFTHCSYQNYGNGQANMTCYDSAF